MRSYRIGKKKDLTPITHMTGRPWCLSRSSYMLIRSIVFCMHITIVYMMQYMFTEPGSSDTTVGLEYLQDATNKHE